METKIDIGQEQKDLLNERYINDLKNLLKTHSTIPEHTPNKLLDCFWLYHDGETIYELYIYINNSWKKTSLT